MNSRKRGLGRNGKINQRKLAIDKNLNRMNEKCLIEKTSKRKLNSGKHMSDLQKSICIKMCGSKASFNAYGEHILTVFL